jgi:hypothetical protein
MRSKPVSVRRTSVTSKLDPPKSMTAAVVPTASSTSWASLAMAATGSGTSMTSLVVTRRAACSSSSSIGAPSRSGWVSTRWPGHSPAAEAREIAVPINASVSERGSAVWPSRTMGPGSSRRADTSRAARVGS